MAPGVSRGSGLRGKLLGLADDRPQLRQVIENPRRLRRLALRVDPHDISYNPDLVPPAQLMRDEGVGTLEEWFQWAAEWAMLLRSYGGIADHHRVLEIGCGSGRTAFPLRHILLKGSYEGFDVVRDKIEFAAATIGRRFPNFRFTWAGDLHNSKYNPAGHLSAAEYRFPYPDGEFDIVFAAGVFTHLMPPDAENYLSEAARVLKPGGRCLLNFFLLDFYRPGQPRPLGFDRPGIAFDHTYEEYGDEFAVGTPERPEEATAFKMSLVERQAGQAGLEVVEGPLPGLWSGTAPSTIGAIDVVVFEKSHAG